MLTYAMLTDIGSRECNEDAVAASTCGDNHCFIVCDGLGAHGMGDAASALVCQVFQEQLQSSVCDGTFLSSTFQLAQEKLLAAQNLRHARQKMKTTAAVLAVADTSVYIGHVGDTRLYVFSNNAVLQRTRDHSIPEILFRAGEITEREIRHHPERNVLLRAIGIEWEKPMYEIAPMIPLSECQAFLLCTDGFWELVDETQMCTLLQQASTVQEWLDKMTEIVRCNGSGKNMDNYSAIAVWNQN